MESRSLDVEGATLRLCSWMPGGGVAASSQPAMLLLHALGEDAATWTDPAEHWSASHAVYALDFRGHGESGRSPRYSFERLRDDVLVVLDRLDHADVTIVGHSLGGIVGYLVASQRPPNLARLVLEEAPAPLPLTPPREVPDDPGNQLGFDWQALVDLFGQRNDPDPAWWAELERIEVQVLVLGGGAASHVDQDELARMAERIPNSSLVTVDAGHNIHATAPDEFRAAVDEFLLD